MNKLVMFVLVVLTLAGCGDGGSDTPPTIHVTGTWHGSVNDKVFGTSMFTLILVQDGVSVTGSYMSINMYGAGEVSGFISGNVLICSLSPTGCTGTMEGMAVMTTNSVGQQQADFHGSGIYKCGGLTFNNDVSGILIRQ